MLGQVWQPGWPAFAWLLGAALVATVALRVLWIARHRAEDERAPLPVLGLTGVPTCLTIGLCLLAVAYHLLAYGLEGLLELPAVPVERAWIVVGVAAIAIGGSCASEWLERRADRES